MPLRAHDRPPCLAHDELVAQVAETVGDGAVAFARDAARLRAVAADHRSPTRAAELRAVTAGVVAPPGGWIEQAAAKGVPGRPGGAAAAALAREAGMTADSAATLVVPLGTGALVVVRDAPGMAYTRREQERVERLAAGTAEAPAPLAAGGVALHERTGAALWLTDASGRTVFVNQALSELVGEPAAALAGRHIDDVLLDEPVAGPGDHAGHPVRGDHLLPDGEGGERWVDVDSVPVVFDGRRMTLHTLHDISARRRAAVALRLRAAAYEGVARVSGQALRDPAFAPLADVATRVVAGVLGADYAGVAFRRGTHRLEPVSLVGWRLGVDGTDLAIEPGSISELALSCDEPIVVRDGAASRYPWPHGARRRRIRSGLWLGLAGGRGLLTVHSRDARDFEPIELELVLQVAEILAARWPEDQPSSSSSAAPAAASRSAASASSTST